MVNLVLIIICYLLFDFDGNLIFNYLIAKRDKQLLSQ